MNVRSCSRLIALLALCAGAACRSEDSQPGGEGASPPPAAPAATQPAPELQRPPQSPAPRPTASGSAKLAYAGELPPLPVISVPAARPPEVVSAVYEFAARRPDVLRYVPCFCGCERNGHTHNEDCFVAGREPDGKPRWDAHGMG
jgi:hypothetical protein